MSIDGRQIGKLLDSLEPVPTGPMQLSRRYLESVRAVEDLARNRSGEDKSWVPRALQEYRDHYARSRKC